MIFKRFIKHIKKNFSFRKKVIVFGGLGILIFFGGIIATNSDSMFSSVLNLSKIAQQRKLDFSQKKKNTCIDTDGGIDYQEKWTITVIISWYQRVEQDSCNSNGTLREWFCGQPGHPAGLLRSENYVNCEYGCYDGVCITTWVLKDVAIEGGSFIASDSQHANIEINLRNIWTTAIHTDGIWHGLSLDGSTYIDYGVDYDLQLNNNSNTLLQPNETHTIFANVLLMGNNSFTNNSYIHISISTYPDTDDVPSNNSYILYLTGNFSSNTGQIVDCTTPENILACNLWLPSCPPECTGQIFTWWIGDIIIESMSIQNNPAMIWSNTVNNKVYVTVKNIWNWDIIIPVANWANRFGFWCRSNEWSFGVSSNWLWQTILWPNESISTELVWEQYNTLWYGSLGNRSMNCSVESQQQQNWNNPDPSNTWIIFETDGTNNSFIINYEVVTNTGNKSTTLSPVKNSETLKLR